MLQKPPLDLDGRGREVREHLAEESPFDFERLLSAARRQWVVVLAVALLFAFIGVLRILTAVPLYTADTQILIDRAATNLVDEYSVSSGISQDDTTTQSQVELMRSESIAIQVAEELGLASDARFLAPAASPMDHLLGTMKDALVAFGLVSVPEPVVAEQELRLQQAVGKLLANVRVQRVPRTFVLSLAYTDPNPATAARIANAWADAYLADQLASKYDATQRASEWLAERIEELRQQSIDADAAVQAFRAEHDLLGEDGGSPAGDRLDILNAQLLDVQETVGTAAARYEQVREILDSGDMDRAIRDSLESGIMNTIRTSYLETLKLYNDLKDRLSPDHERLVRLTEELQENKKLMFTELGRIAETLRSDLELAQRREANLISSIRVASGETALANQLRVQLRELERKSETTRNLYQSLLGRYQESVQEREFPVSEAKVIARAKVPGAPSYPNKRSTLMQFLMLGLVAGGGLGAFREYRDRFFRTGEQVREELGLKFIGLAPKVTDAADPASMGISEGEIDGRVVIKRSTVLNHVVDHPLSSFAETMRAGKIAANLVLEGREPKVIGVVSCLPGEGKSTVAANFAETLAMQGSRTLLIDGDLRNPGLTRGLARHVEAGLVEAILERKPIRDLIIANPETGLDVLPAVVKRRISHSSEMLSSLGMSEVMKQAADAYEYIIIDLPPLAPVVDAAAISPRIDGFLFVVEWGKTSRRMVRSTLEEEPLIAERCLGVVLNKADSKQMKYYREYGSKDYYYSRYSSYYQQDA